MFLEVFYKVKNVKQVGVLYNFLFTRPNVLKNSHVFSLHILFKTLKILNLKKFWLLTMFEVMYYM